ncbi:tat pathway signal sequence [Paraphaeosphaeria sporulosa]
MALQDEWTLALAAQPIAWAFSFCATCLAVGCVPDLGKWTGFIVLLAPASGALYTSPNLSPNKYFNDTYSRFVIILFSYMVALCFMPGSRADKWTQVTKDKTKELDTSWRAGWKRAYNARGIGLAWENPYLWPEQKSTIVFAKPSSETYKDKPVEAPASRHALATRSKWSAVLIHCVYLLINYVAMKLYFEYRVSATIGGFVRSDLSPEKEGILRRLFLQSQPEGLVTSPVTVRELQIRLLLAANKFIPDVLSLSAFHDLLAIIFIATGIDQPWEWPPLFGPVSEAYTMRRFWANFWHRLVYKSFNFHASTFTKALRIPQGTSFSRILNNCLVFVLSAIMHATVTWLYGGKCAWGRGTMVFWCIQPLSFVLEGLVQYNWKQYRKSKLWWMNASVLAAFERVAGYGWVVAWLMWCAPKADFAFQNCRA